MAIEWWVLIGYVVFTALALLAIEIYCMYCRREIRRSQERARRLREGHRDEAD